MTENGEKIDFGPYLMRGMWRNLLLATVACLAVGLWVTGPTWGSLGLALVLLAGGWLGVILFGIAATAATGRKPPQVVFALVPAAALELLRLGLVTWSGLGAAEAAWMGAWSTLVNALVALVMTKLTLLSNAAQPDGHVMRRECPGSLLAPRSLFPAVAGICGDVAACLLVVWSPWLVLVTFAESAGGGLLKDGSTAQAWAKAAGGFALLALALVLWLR